MEGRPYYLGKNKEVYDAEVYAIYRALKAIDQWEGSGHQYTIFSDSASAVDRTRSDSMGPRQRFALAIYEAGGRIASRNNTVTSRWTPAHQGVNEAADTWAKSAAEGRPQRTTRRTNETNLSHMTRRAMGARSQATKD